MLKFLTNIGPGELGCRELVDRIAAHGALGPPERTTSGPGNKAIGDKLS